MHISTLRLKNFQSFGPEPTTINLNPITYVLGPNGAGKTAVLEALARLFSPISAQRKIKLTDFHIPQVSQDGQETSRETELWVEVEIEFPETNDTNNIHPSVPTYYSHMSLDPNSEIPRIRVRLTANINDYDEVEEKIEYVLGVDENGEPIETKSMSRYDRGQIEVHYLPARRDPADHISYTASSLIGRTLRAMDWSEEKNRLIELGEAMSQELEKNNAVMNLREGIRNEWKKVHAGQYLTDPSITFGYGSIDKNLSNITIHFSPSHSGEPLPFELLSDGQKSLLYISLVLAWQRLSHEVLTHKETGVDVDKLRPPVHIIFALEEPENSLSPQYLGRIVQQLRSACEEDGAQALIATHAPTLLRRVEPDKICFLRLNSSRETTVHYIVLPTEDQEAAKYVQEAVMAFPELYFSRLVILGEGASELVVLPRILAAAGIREDDASVSVAPLGGRHVNHFWKLLNDLQIPYITLLDLDSTRFSGGWGRVINICKQVNKLNPTYDDSFIKAIPKWNDSRGVTKGMLFYLENRHKVFFSYQVDLDLMMMEAFPDAYGVTKLIPEEKTLKEVLGKKYHNVNQLSPGVFYTLEEYSRKFVRSSKPASHIAALGNLSDKQLLNGLPPVLKRLIKTVRTELELLPE